MKKFASICSAILISLSLIPTTACSNTNSSEPEESTVTEVVNVDSATAQTEELLSAVWTTTSTENVTNVWTTTDTTAVSSEVEWTKVSVQKDFEDVTTSLAETAVAVTNTISKVSEATVTSADTTSNVSETTATTTTPASTTAKTTEVTSVASKTNAAVVEDSLRVVLPVENIQQLPELPAGCEITSTTIALNYELGITESKMDMVSYLPMDKWPDENSVWSSPWDVFVGDPSLNYYGAYSPVIKKTLENYFKKNKLDKEYKVTDLSGSSVSELYDAIDDGHPVIVWATIKMKASKPGNSWYLEDGSKYTWIAGEHCLVLIGYDLEQDTVILSDPYDSRGTVEYSTETFEARYEELFKQALIIEKIEK